MATMWASSRQISMGCCQVYFPVSQLPDQALPSIETEVKEEFPPSQQFNRRQAPSTPDLSEDSAPESPQIFRGDSSPLNTDGSGVDRLGDTEPRHFTNEDLPSPHEKFSVKRNTPGSADALITPPPSKKRRTERQLTVEFYREHEGMLDTKQNHGPRHDHWSFDEREALCLLYIFCECDSAFEEIAKILCAYFQEPFRARQARAQWDTYGYIFRKRPVYNPKKAWMDKRAGFEAAATRAGIELELRPVELKARKLNPKNTTVVEKVAKYDAWFLGQLVRRRDSYQARSRATQRPDTPQSMGSVSPLASKSLDGNSSALLELLEAAKPTTTPVLEGPIQPGVQEMPAPESELVPALLQEGEQALGINTPESNHAQAPPPSGGPRPFINRRNSPPLLYRVYHDESNGHNSPTLFRAKLFNLPGNPLVPPAEDTDLLVTYASWHTWHKYHPDNAPQTPLISCTTSLVWAMHKARKAEAKSLNPHISVIDATLAFSSPADGSNRGYHAAPLIAQARKRGLVPGMSYRGSFEWFVWGEIAPPAILHDLPFARLRSLAPDDFGVADLLALDDVDPEKSIAGIRRGLLRQKVLLEAAGGHALGRLAVLFGLGVGTAPAVVAQFVYDVLQGWGLWVVEEESEMERMAECFVDGIKSAEAVGRSTTILFVDDGEEEGAMKAAFVSGVERALRVLEKKRRPARR